MPQMVHHVLFSRMLRRAISAGGFLTTIHNITDVAAARAYLDKALGLTGRGSISDIPCKNILSVVIPEIDLRRSTNRYPSGLSIPTHQ